MNINKIRFENFKCFKELDIDFKKITILTGKNSSGKSSVLYGLLAPLQSDDFPFKLSPNGEHINIGDFIEMSYNNLKNNKIRLYFEIDNSVKDEDHRVYKIDSVWKINPENNQPKLFSLEITTNILNISIKSERTYYLLNAKIDKKYYKSHDYEFSTSIFSTLETTLGNLNNDEQKDNDGIKIKKIQKPAIITDLTIKNVDDVWTTLRKRYGYAASLLIREPATLFRYLDNNLGFINSFRLFPERTYYQKTKSDYKVGGYGENYIDQLLQWDETKSKKLAEIKSALKNLNLVDNVSFTKLGGGRFELRVRVQPKGPEVSFVDVGFGISQFLPILVADMQLDNDSTLLIAQPEIHLHPDAQSKLADYFVEKVKKDKRYIIETHSEYLLNRLRLAIVKGEISSDDVAVYYFENTRSGSLPFSIKFAKDGQIIDAPKGFFDTYMMDVMDIAMAA